MTEGMNIRINGIAIKPPSDCDIQEYNVTKASRTADATMRLDLIAKKVKLLLVYNVISGAELVLIKNIIYGTDMFFTVEYNDDDGVARLKTMYVGDITRKRFRTEGVWYWKDFKFDLIEQ